MTFIFEGRKQNNLSHNSIEKSKKEEILRASLKIMNF